MFRLSSTWQSTGTYWTMFITEAFHLTSFQIRHWSLKFDGELSPSCARDMKCQITGFARTLNACPRFIANITNEFPTRFWDSVHSIDRLHEDVISNIGLWDP